MMPTHRMPPLGGPGNTQVCVVTGRSSGLRTFQPELNSYLPWLPDPLESVPNTAFVFAYRCGAAPESHRVPY